MEYYNYYEINVALNGRHLFATHKRSCDTKMSTFNIYDILKAKFPEDEGYTINVTGYVEYGRDLTEMVKDR